MLLDLSYILYACSLVVLLTTSLLWVCCAKKNSVFGKDAALFKLIVAAYSAVVPSPLPPPLVFGKNCFSSSTFSVKPGALVPALYLL